MNIRDIFITLRYKISYGSTVEWYNYGAQYKMWHE